jgi:hypothetical protein
MLFGGDAKPSDASSTAQLVEANPDIASRDLFYGVGGRANAPRTDVAYEFKKRSEKGANTNFEVVDPAGRKWDAKFGYEARSEVATSRILWAIGFHQPPVYYVREWKIAGGKEAGVQQHARFRSSSRTGRRRASGNGRTTRSSARVRMRGLIVTMAILNSWDLKTSNNKIYEVNGRPVYVVKDLGESLGSSVNVFLGSRDHLADFQKEGFIRGVHDGRVDLYFKPVILNWGVADEITVDDVLWTCRRLAKLSDKQWRDAFRAAGYDARETDAYVDKLKHKVREGLALEGKQA